MQTYFPAHSGSTSGARRHPFREDLTGVSAGVHPPSETAEPGSGTQSASLAATVASGDASGAERRAEGPPASTEQRSQTRRQAVIIQVRRLVQAIRDGDDKMVEEAILSLSQRSRYLAPLAMVVGAFAMLFQGVKLLFTNWRLTLVQILPAMWIWAAMLDLKAHALHGKEFHIFRGPLLWLVLLVIASLTAGSFFLNAVFAFAISKPGAPQIRPAFSDARTHIRTILAWGLLVGLALGFATMVVIDGGRCGFR